MAESLENNKELKSEVVTIEPVAGKPVKTFCDMDRYGGKTSPNLEAEYTW